MWNDFSDAEIIDLATQYGIEEEMVVIGGLLFNREEVESRLTEVEYENAFGECFSLDLN